MKNLENFQVKELNNFEIQKTNGGGLIFDLFKAIGRGFVREGRVTGNPGALKAGGAWHG
ncbi:hypothetical protein [uncultured Tenacibaculum sp.]|uniref:hypothetical protein n=1 Tax=uncultured Tenacibaculum sp. TaxID=174713 RepID=UPI00260E47EC|nr:hypothetical protein [uncultured Tenacibaculum sp.]